MNDAAFKYTLFSEQRPAAIVVSHERSGTHFLMNALAACYGYAAEPWINFDFPDTNINYFKSWSVREHLLSLAARPIANIVKSHHAVDFFVGELPRLTDRYVFLSVCRHPVSVMVSYCFYTAYRGMKDRKRPTRSLWHAPRRGGRCGAIIWDSTSTCSGVGPPTSKVGARRRFRSPESPSSAMRISTRITRKRCGAWLRS